MGVQRKEYRRIELDEVSLGVTFDASPDFIAEGKPAKSYNGKPIPPKPGIYIGDNEGRFYTGLIYNLNPKDVNLGETYKIIVRGVGWASEDLERSTHVILEQRLEEDNMIHIKVSGENYKNPDDEVCGRFLKYRIFMPRKVEGRNLEISDYVFGSVRNIRKGHKFADFQPVSIVPEKRFEKWKNRIIRND